MLSCRVAFRLRFMTRTNGNGHGHQAAAPTMLSGAPSMPTAATVRSLR